MKIVVGFLTYNDSSAKYLPDFLSSLKDALSFLDASKYRVLAFDNSDENHHVNRQALDDFNALHPDFVTRLSAGENLGFSRAYNILIRQADNWSSEYFLVINPDTCLDKDAIFHLCSALDKDASLGSVSPKIHRWDFPSNTKTKLIDSVGIVCGSGLRFSDLGQGNIDNKQYDRYKILGPSGAAGLFRLQALYQVAEKCNYFDENFFMYKEDCDLAYRLAKGNWPSRLIPEALIYHDRTASSRGNGHISKALNRLNKSRQIRSWSFVNQHFLFIKHWKKEPFLSRIVIICQIISFGIFSLILEQFILKEYGKILEFSKKQKSID